MADQDIALIAHLLRRAGFGASRDEIEAKASQGYNNVVQDLLNPEAQPAVENDLLMRYFPAYYLTHRISKLQFCGVSNLFLLRFNPVL
mgnify:CR=1 FL=1